MKNIYQKLVEVRKAVPYLKKDNSGFQFKYVSSSQTLGSLREAMDTQGLLLVPRVVSYEVRDHTTAKDKHEYFTIINAEFTWINADVPEEQITCGWTGQGLDDGEKGVGKALTYAEKYFLLKFFNIATDKDDPDSFQKEAGGKPSGKSNDAKQEPAKAIPATEEARKTLDEKLTSYCMDATGEIDRNLYNTVLKEISKATKAGKELFITDIFAEKSQGYTISDKWVQKCFDNLNAKLGKGE